MSQDQVMPKQDIYAVSVSQSKQIYSSFMNISICVTFCARLDTFYDFIVSYSAYYITCSLHILFFCSLLKPYKARLQQIIYGTINRFI